MRIALMTCGAALLCSTAQAEVPRVVTDITPVHSLVATVMKGVGAPTLLVEPGASPHSYALRPSKAAALDRADAVFWMGEALASWLEGPLETLGSGAVAVELMEVPGTTVLEFREGATFAKHEGHDDHDDDHDDHKDEHDGHEEDEHGHDEHDHDAHEDDDGHDDHDDHAEDSHGHGHEGVDPHGWLDPQNGRVWLGAIAAELSKLDPENAATYAANAAQGQAELEALEAELKASLTPFHETKFIVFHDAYHYFENRFDLEASGAISLSDASDPGAARIAEIRDTVAALGVTCVFSEPQFNPGLVASVAAGGTHVAQLDPLGSTLQPGADLYADLLRGMTTAMLSCQ